MEKNDIFNMTLSAVSAAIQQGTLAPDNLARAYLDRILELDPGFNAYIDVQADQVMEAARTATQDIAQGAYRGPLHGVPVAVKDVIHISGRPTRGGSAATSSDPSSVTADCVQRLEAAGCVVIGKTHTVEFALGGWGTNARFGTPRNPWGKDRHVVPGGSSSGSAVAVAAGMAVAALGTDTGGSIRVPSAWCNLVGLKTSGARVSTHGLMTLSHTLDTVGPMTRTAMDAMLLFEALAPTASRAAFNRHLHQCWNQPHELVLGYFTKSQLASLEVTAAVIESYQAFIDVFRRAGMKLSPFEFPFNLQDIAQANWIITQSEGYFEHGGFLETAPHLLDPDVSARLSVGKAIAAHDYMHALQKMQESRGLFRSAFKKYSALLTPTTPFVAPAVDSVNQNVSPSLFTRWANFLDLPALSVPGRTQQNQLPIGMQIVGLTAEEEKLLALGVFYQGHCPDGIKSH